MARIVPDFVGPNRLASSAERRRGRVEAPAPANDGRASNVSPPAGLRAVLAAGFRALCVPYTLVRRIAGRFSRSRA